MFDSVIGGVSNSFYIVGHVQPTLTLSGSNQLKQNCNFNSTSQFFCIINVSDYWKCSGISLLRHSCSYKTVFLSFNSLTVTQLLWYSMNGTGGALLYILQCHPVGRTEVFVGPVMAPGPHVWHLWIRGNSSEDKKPHIWLALCSHLLLLRYTLCQWDSGAGRCCLWIGWQRHSRKARGRRAATLALVHGWSAMLVLHWWLTWKRTREREGEKMMRAKSSKI